MRMRIPLSTSRSRVKALAVVAALAAATSLAPVGPSVASTVADPPAPTARPAAPGSVPVVPAPRSVRTLPGTGFRLTDGTTVTVGSRRPGARAAAEALTAVLRPSTGYPLPIVRPGQAPLHRTIWLQLTGSPRLGDEGYRLDVNPGVVLLRAHRPAGLFYGVQTLRQLLPGAVERDSVQPGPWRLPGVHIADKPRFAWRGAMLDVARHFFSVGEVERYIDLLSQYKINVLHLHLADDQGWRIQIDGWPRLTSHGGSTEVGGGPGGYYTQADYGRIVRYAQARHVMVVPEIDMPGHTNAALSSYAELNCDGQAPPLYTGTEVGFSSLCIDKPITYRFIDDVVRQLAAMTPGPFLHLGGDEAHSTPHEDYVRFVDRVDKIVSSHGKRMVGWEEISGAHPAPSSVAQFWWDAPEASAAAAKGMHLVMSPADKAYLDMKYDESTPLGLDWAGLTSVQDSYEWDPGTVAEGVPESAVLGPEAPLWSETLEDIDDVEYMAFPRMAGIAERGWSPAAGRTWEEYRHRLGAQGPRWDAQGVNYYRAPEVPWH